MANFKKKVIKVCKQKGIIDATRHYLIKESLFVSLKNIGQPQPIFHLFSILCPILQSNITVK